MPPAYYDYRKLPIVGPWIVRVGQVEQILATPCDAGAEIWVLAFWYNIPQLLYSFVKPDPVDYLTERFGVVAGKKGKRRFRPKGRLESIPIKKYTRAWAAFKLIGIQQRIGFYFLIVDATTEFAVNWTSTAYQWGGCPNPVTPYCRMRGVSEVQAGGGSEGRLFNTWGVESYRRWIGDPTSIQTEPGFKQTCFVNIVSKPRPGVEWCGPVHYELFDFDGGRVLERVDSVEQDDGTWVARSAYTDWLGAPVGRNWAIMLYADRAGFFDGRDSTFAVYGSADSGVKPDP